MFSNLLWGYCCGCLARRDCTRKLDNHLTFLQQKGQITSFTPFTLTRSVSTRSPSTHIARSTIKYVPQRPNTVRSLLSTLSNDVDEVFEASLVKSKTLSERAQEIARKEQRRLILHFLVALLFSIPTFIM